MSNPQLNALYFSSAVTHNTINFGIRHFNESQNFCQTDLFKDNQNSIQIVLYMDYFETNNPLGDQRNEDKINVFYFRLDNFENCFQSIDYITQTVILSDASYKKNMNIKKSLNR